MIKPQNKYAVIMTATQSLEFGANAFINSLDYYGNKDLDFYLINDFDEKYFENAKESVSYTHLTLPTICSV